MARPLLQFSLLPHRHGCKDKILFRLIACSATQVEFKCKDPAYKRLMAPIRTIATPTSQRVACLRSRLFSTATLSDHHRRPTPLADCPHVPTPPAALGLRTATASLHLKLTAKHTCPFSTTTTTTTTTTVNVGTQLNNRKSTTQVGVVQKRRFHAARKAAAPFLAGPGLAWFFHSTRGVLTVLPILWRWNWFKSHPRTMWTLASIPLVIAAALIGSAYEQHPFTERSRLMFIDEPTELELAAAHSDSMVTKNRHLLLPTNHPDYILVHEIVSDLAAVAGPGRNWELHVLQSDDVVNAFVVPTGQIFVYTGLLRAAEDKDAVAAVIAHEFAHVLSRHGAEKLGIQHLAHLAWDFFHSLLYTLTLNLPIFSDIAGRGLDATKEVLTSLPYSRMCEKEADVIGLYLMSVAGYNPRAAIDFWAHLSRIDTSTSPTTTTPTTPPPTNKSHLLFKSPKSYEFLSDHPSHSTRASDLKQHLPAALKIYHARSVLAERVTHLRGRRLRRRDSAVGLAFGKDDTGDGETKVVTMEELNRDLFDVLKEHLSEAVESGGDAAWVRDEAVAMADKVVKARVVAL